MAKFLNREELYRVVQRELPEFAYPDGPPAAFFSTADSDATADVAATAYGKLERIYQNYFPQTTDERVGDWIKKMFVGVSFDTGVTLQDKRDRIIAKVRKQPTIALWEVLKILASYAPEGKYVQISENCGASGSWELGASMLGVTTILGYDHKFADLGISVDDWCDLVSSTRWVLGSSELGVDTLLADPDYLSIIEPQLNAYGYEVRMFEFSVTGTSYDQLIRNLNETEPARSVHIVRQNLSPSDYGLVNPVTDVDEFSLVNCIKIDPTSQTGYSGLVP